MKNWMTVLVLVLIAGFSRLIPHPWNFTAIGAMALFAGSRMPNKLGAFVAPFLSLLWTDAVLGFHATMVYVYASVALMVLLGFWAKGSWRKLGAGTLMGSLLFFFISNFGVWMTSGIYPMTGQGLFQTYVMALPFLHYQVAGDFFYAAVLFGAYEWVRAYRPEWCLASAKK